jgi:hypothetical protein
MKRVAIGLGVLMALLVLVAAGGAGWFLHETRGFLVPPPDPAGQPGIATRAEPDPATPAEAPVLVSGFDWETLTEPPKSARAWTRWWWPGGDVGADTLQRQLAELDEAGFGGAEIQPFLSGMIAIEDPATWERVYRFDTPGYYATLDTLMTAAEARGMQLDLTHFSGWPPGGPEINLADSNTLLAWSEAEVEGGAAVTLRLPKPRAGASEYVFTAMEFAGADFNNFPAEHATLLSVVAARPIHGEHAWSPFNLDDTVALDPSSVVVLDAQVQDGVLRWDAPAGEWRIIASWLLPSGEVPMGAAQKPQGFVLDHLREPVVLGHYAYAFGQRTGLAAHYGKGFRGFFNDSLEFRLKRRGVADILPEFRARRGYELSPWLPAIHVEGLDNVYFSEILGIRAAPEFSLSPLDERVRHDYRQTLSDLVIERFVEAGARWAGARGLVSRAQSYGMDIDILRALGANTIPETEQLWAGGSNLGLRFASSAAALYGRPLASAESFVWIQRDWTTTARKLKAAADKLFLSGINHIVHHGTPYPWTGDAAAPFGEEGWTPFSGPQNPAHFSSIVAPGNSALWPDIPELNLYIARSQNLLRQGSPAIDVLVYYPFLGFHGANPEGGAAEPLLNGSLPDADPVGDAREDPMLTEGKKMLDRGFTLPAEQKAARERWVEGVMPLLAELDRRGISWGWVNDHALQNGLVGTGTLRESGGRYQALLLADVPMIQHATLDALATLAGAGVPVAVAGEAPSRQPGFLDAEAGDRRVREQVEALLRQGAVASASEPSALADLLAARIASPVRHLAEGSIRSYRRALGDDADIVLFANQDATAATLDVAVTPSPSLSWFDAMSGAAWPAEAGDGRLQLALRGFESRFLVRGVPMPASLAPRLPDSLLVARAKRSRDLADWSLAVDGGAPRPAVPGDWRDDAATRHARVGVYTTTLAIDAPDPGSRWLLDLGLVQGSAEVRVNGTPVGRASLPPFLLDVGSALKTGDNLIEIELRAPLRNFFVARALAGDARYAHMKGYDGQLVTAGLAGPVRLLEVDD